MQTELFEYHQVLLEFQVALVLAVIQFGLYDLVLFLDLVVYFLVFQVLLPVRSD